MSDSVALEWGSAFIGLIVSLGMYGVALGQYGFYTRSFPHDRKALKLMVLLVFIMDTLHTYGAISYQWALLVWCHHSPSSACMSVLPWEILMASVISFCLTFAVQSFYAHRVWIISGRNKLITSAVLLTAFVQLVLGLICLGNAISTKSVAALYTSVFTCGTSAVASALCDLLITGSIFFYLHPKRSGVRRSGSAIQQLTNVTVNMGLFTCLLSLALAVLFVTQKGSYLVGAPGTFIAKSYVNSLLAVLNARRSMRESVAQTFALSTIAVTRDATETP
ncbi:hypothetical protein BV22DRAFT_1037068 [Leucogyrophana mollusca]|uniref:Uncharacterized protein n=1 Tax=Leucogyrophana mollusca TaxID=85980 RepID=A0ACB8BB24_9AGAM|nr:hypothetical protein BV22DRAFT_1037068 [Leucogyrophana mollusca]